MIEKCLFIQNEWTEATEFIASINPATLETLGQSGLASSQDCLQAIQSAQKAHPEWRDMSIQSKKEIFKRARQILLERSLETCQLITREKESPLTESMIVEVFSSLEALDYYIHNMESLIKSKKMKHYVILFRTRCHMGRDQTDRNRKKPRSHWI